MLFQIDIITNQTQIRFYCFNNLTGYAGSMVEGIPWSKEGEDEECEWVCV